LSDWTTIAELGTAAGTLVLAVATFGATRSANRAARTAERAFEARLRPVLVQSRREDPVEKIMWGDRHWSRVPGGQAWVEAGADAVYLAMSLRNVGAGMAVIHGWHADAALNVGVDGHFNINPNWYVSARGGLFRGDVKGAYFADATPVYVDETSTKYYAGAGFGYDFSNNFSLGLNYDYYKVDKAGLSLDPSLVSVSAEYRF